ncbi:MAG: RNA methyltransferase [Firmicutes bacterium]|nr:RNA methyltransferase [Bacillota bacterium]MDD7602526.1 RNA methyltransferase [Bacillota bacterium]MDY5856788.1 RNA methyltransferase [Anaerovoracaceae bacterium]
MREITSKDNKIVKLCEQLAARKYRDRLGLYLIEGENLLEEAVQEGAAVETVLIRRDCRKIPPGLEDRTYILGDGLFRKLSLTDTSQGSLAIVKKPEVSRKALLEQGAAGNFVVLDRLQDPGNIGTIIRTADAAGYGLVAVMKGTADVFSPKVVRAAAGSLFRVPVVFMNDYDELVTFVRAAGVKLAATCFDTDRYYYEEDLRENVALIIGNEGNGISPELIGRADIKIKIPMAGSIESLNAAVAAAVLMYETVRQRARQGEMCHTSGNH